MIRLACVNMEHIATNHDRRQANPQANPAEQEDAT